MSKNNNPRATIPKHLQSSISTNINDQYPSPSKQWNNFDNDSLPPFGNCFKLNSLSNSHYHSLYMCVSTPMCRLISQMNYGIRTILQCKRSAACAYKYIYIYIYDRRKSLYTSSGIFVYTHVQSTNVKALSLSLSLISWGSDFESKNVVWHFCSMTLQLSNEGQWT